MPGESYANPDADGKLPGGYRTDLPWNSAQNAKLANQLPGVYHCTSDPGPIFNTSYVVVVGQNTGFPHQGSMSFNDIEGGLLNSILILETHDSGIHWMEPRDWSIDEAVKGINSQGKKLLDGHHGTLFSRGSPHALFADGSIRPVNPKIDHKILEQLLEVTDGNKPKDEFVHPEIAGPL